MKGNIFHHHLILLMEMPNIYSAHREREVFHEFTQKFSFTFAAFAICECRLRIFTQHAKIKILCKQRAPACGLDGRNYQNNLKLFFPHLEFQSADDVGENSVSNVHIDISSWRIPNSLSLPNIPSRFRHKMLNF